MLLKPNIASRRFPTQPVQVRAALLGLQHLYVGGAEGQQFVGKKRLGDSLEAAFMEQTLFTVMGVRGSGLKPLVTEFKTIYLGEAHTDINPH